MKRPGISAQALLLLSNADGGPIYQSHVSSLLDRTYTAGKPARFHPGGVGEPAATIDPPNAKAQDNLPATPQAETLVEIPSMCPSGRSRVHGSKRAVELAQLAQTLFHVRPRGITG
jgi:hypothetical protein